MPKVKYLGVIFDEKLLYNHHVDFILERSQRMIRTLYPLINPKSKLSIKNKILIYTAIIRAMLTYANPVWGICAKTHRKKIQVSQNKCLKLIHKLPWRFSTETLHSISKIPLINELIDDHTESFIKMCKASTNNLIKDLFP